MESSWNRMLWLVGGLVAGASIMFILDPERGRTRRALARDKVGSMVLHTSTTAGKNVRNLRNHAKGMMHNAPSLVGRNGTSNIDLSNQIRAGLANLLPENESVHVTVHNGRVTLSGPILAGDVQKVVEGVAMVPGVSGVDNRMTVYQSPEEMPRMNASTESPTDQPGLSSAPQGNG